MNASMARHRSSQALANRQLWKMEHAYIRIVALGQSVVQYKMFKRHGHKEESVHLSGIDALESYLKTHEARLVESVHATAV